MIDLSYQIKGADAVIRDLNAVRLDRIQDEVSAILDDMAKDAANYPPELPGQRYQRTGDLRRGWTDGQDLFPQSGPTMLEGVRENSVSHGPFVQGVEDQARIHQGRWRTNDAIMTDWEARVAQRIEDALAKVLPK